MNLIEEKRVVSVDELISMIKKRIRQKRGIVSKMAMDDGCTPSNVTQSLQTLYKNMKNLEEQLQDLFSILGLHDILIDVQAKSNDQGTSEESAPTSIAKRRRDPLDEKKSKKKRDEKYYKEYLERAKIPGFAKFLKPLAGFWDWYENKPGNEEIKSQVTSLLERVERISEGEVYDRVKWKRNVMRMLLSGFPYKQIDLILEFCEKNPLLARKYNSFFSWDLNFLERLRFEAFKNSDEFTEIMEDRFPQVWGGNR